ncbi:MAG: T9SS type B sorting domain-containing protein [Paludibacteraceae bacterium]|nr:T9SS type B sorting domain-containing protein [Paludibacteraceae bacterium]
MNKFGIKLIAILCCLLSSIGGASAQGSARSWSSASYVPININSGNPAFPYPQFLEYKVGKTLAKYNAEGVTHADMEKTGREAYEIMSHRCRYDGGTHCGVPYITFNNFRKFGDKEMPQGGAQFCTEGDGYMMLAAAIFADQATFNGLWMWIHDNRIPHRVRYQDGQIRLPNYEFGGGLPICYALEGSTSENDGSATDGDDDIAMALLIAYKQWGEFMMQDGKPVLDYSGKPISYKEAAEDFLKAFVDTFSAPNTGGHMSGNIGVDGYVKGGNKGGEVSSWRNNQTLYPDISKSVYIGGTGGDGNTHTDYCAPAYYNEFAKWFESGDVTANDWQIGQYKRAEASSDWLCGQAYSQGLVSSIGTTNMATDGQPTFTNFSEGEDFRTMWRMAQNYLWHGTPEYTWNPKTHQIEKGTNTYEYDMALRAAALMKEPPALDGKGKWCSKLGASPDPGQPEFWGPSQIKMCYNTEGGVLSHYSANYALGCAAPAVVINEDLGLIADMYRQSELVWDDASGESKNLTDDERYIESMPKYFHGWFRCLPLLTYTGNWHAPSDMVSAANMKVYMSVDKTYAYVDDQIDYTVQYRNYGSADATGVKIETEIDPNYEVVSISNGGKFSGGKIVWNIGTVPGFKTGHLAETIDSVSFRVVARDTLNPRICLTSKISGSNFEEWVSNEYPNHATYTMERNCVDILANRSLAVKKSANRTAMNPNDVVKFTVEFENKSEGESSWLNGGRDNVRMSYGNYLPNGDDEGDWTNTTFYQYYRFWNDAQEAYINMGNYRVSYFLNDINKGFYGDDNPNGWLFYLDNENDVSKYGYFPETGGAEILFQKIPAGEDEDGKAWNQRFIVKFPNVLTATTTHVYDKLDSKYLLHKGVYGPGLYRTALKTKNATNMKFKVADDWSYSKAVENNGSYDNLSGQACNFVPITPGWYNPDKFNEEITNFSRYACSPDLKGFDRVLVEEFDGYTWRRVMGKGPLPGREAYDVVVIDTIPIELEWDGFITDKALGVTATYTPASGADEGKFTGIVKWTVPEMLVGEKGKLVYQTVAKDIGCKKTPQPDDKYFKNVAWISSKTDSPDSSQVDLMISCNELPPVIDPQASLFKDADRKKAEVGENISYTVYFKNTEGTVIEGNFSSKDSWTTLGGGNLPNVKGEISCDQNKNQGVRPPYFFTDKKAYGKDVTLQTQWSGNDGSLYLVFRYQGKGTPGGSGFEGIGLKLSTMSGGQYVKFEVYEGSKLIAEDKTNKSCPAKEDGTYSPMDLMVMVKEDKMYVYINDLETPLATYKGLTSSKSGYMGIYSGPTGCERSLVGFSAEVDHAFDVRLYDQIPAELGNITDISHKGVYDEAKRLITWPSVGDTPETSLAPGDSIGYTFTAEVVSCNNYINNYGLATVYGRDTLKVLNTVECGEVECDLTDAVAKLNVEEICEGDSTYIKAVATPKSKGYTYEFFNGKTSLNDDKPIKVDSFFVKEAGSYSVTVYNEEIAGCKISSKSVKLTVNPLPDVALENGVALCDGEGLDLSKATIEGYDLNWYSDDVAAFEVTDLNIDGKDVLGAYFYTATDKTTKCVGKVQMMEVSKEAIPDVPTVTSPKEFAVGTGKEDITKLASSANGRVVWYESKTATDSLRTPVTISVAKEDTIVYYVSAVSKGGCESERDSVVIYITSSNKPKVSDTTLCVGEKIDVTTLVEAPEAGQSLIWCDETGAPLSEPTPFESTTPGETKYYVKSTNGTAESDIAEITITTVGVGTAKTDDVSYCEDANAEKLVATTDNNSLSTFVKADDPSKFEWYLGGVKLDESALIPSTLKVSSTTTNTYKVVPTYTISSNHVCKGDTADLDVTVKHIDAPAVNNVITYTLGDTLTDGSFKSLLTQDPSAVTPGKDMTIVWYDENMSELKSEPIPSADKSMTTDVKLKYYVSQRDADGCESVLSDVDVIVSLTPVPKTKVARFCEDYLSTESIEDFVEKSDPSYSLKWYDADKSKGGLEISMPAISTTKTTKQPTDTTVYYVCQVDDNGAESSTVPVKVILYARPELKTHFDTVCSRAVNLDTMWIVSNDVSNVYSSFTDESGNPLNNYNAIDKTGHYNVTGYFKMPNDTSIKCESNSPKEIYVEIHRIDSLSIVGAASACPGASVELSAVLKGDTYNSDITYTWNTANKSTMADAGNFVSEPLNDPTKFEVTVSDGFCEKTVSHTVKIGQGEVNGSIIFTDEDGNTEAISAHGDPISFYSCGTKYSLFADLESDANDFKWSTGGTSQAIQLDTEGEYVVTFTNECETSQKVKVADAGIKNNTVGRDTILCEGAKYVMDLDFSCKETPTVEWKKDGVEVGTSNSISISSASTSDDGKYTYTITNRNCVVEETYGTLTVSEAPKFTKIADDTVICEGSDAQIGLSELTPSTATIEWNSDATLVSSGMMAVVNPTATTTYRFTVSQAGGCEVKDSIIVEVEEPIEFTVSPTDTIVCMTPGSVRLFTNVSQGKPRKYTWTNEAGDVLATSPIYKAPTDLIGETVYTVSLSNEICETVTAKSTIKVVGYLEIASVNQKGYREIEIVPLKNNESTNVMYKVDNSEYQTSEAFTDLKYGTHTAYIIDEYGCQSDFQFVTEAPGIEFPTVITPNGDGVNDAFISEVVAEAYPDAVVTIYDRFGKKLTEIKGSESWDGTYLGRKMPATDYWYEIWIDEIRKKYVGHFTLINE